MSDNTTESERFTERDLIDAFNAGVRRQSYEDSKESDNSVWVAETPLKCKEWITAKANASETLASHKSELMRFVRDNWRSVGDELPDSSKKVLACFERKNGIKITITAFYAGKYRIEDDMSDIDLDYCEEEDQYYLPEGWYEQIENWDEYSFLTCSFGKVTHWKPLDQLP